MGLLEDWGVPHGLGAVSACVELVKLNGIRLAVFIVLAVWAYVLS